MLILQGFADLYMSYIRLTFLHLEKILSHYVYFNLRIFCKNVIIIKNKGGKFMKRSIVIDTKVLRKARKATEISQQDMAKGLGVTRKTYERYEKKGERVYLDKDVVMKIASLLNIEYDTIVLLDIEKEIERIENYPVEKLKEKLHR